MKRRIISCCVVLALIAGFFGLTRLLSGNTAVAYGQADGVITFSETGADLTADVTGGERYTAAENDGFLLQLDASGSPIFVHKASGREWRATPADDGGNSRYSSALTIDFYTGNSSSMTVYSSEHCVARNQMRVYQTDGGVRVEYVFGEMQVEYIYPQMISKERMEALFAKMSEDDAAYLQRRYTLYELTTFNGENRTYLLQEYPRLAHEDLYILTDDSTRQMKKRIDEIFRGAGYTLEDQAKDNGDSAAEVEHPQTLRAAVDYALTQTGFTATVDLSDCAFYNDNPIAKIQLLPYFDSFSAADSGYFVLPQGSGALMRVAPGERETEFSVPVYGENVAVTGRIDDRNGGGIFPVFGQYKNGGGYFCILGDGNRQATICADRNASCSAVSASYAPIDSGSYSMSTQNPVQLFATSLSEEALTAEYLLLPALSEDTAYSEMARLYRDRLKADGALPKTASTGVPLLAEFVHAVRYDTMLLGFLPTSREFALTTFDDAAAISGELAALTGGDNLNVLLTGWNRKGLSLQKAGAVQFSGAAGGKKGYNALLDTLTEQGISAYLDLKFCVTPTFSDDGISPSHDAARGLNNSIVSLKRLDAQTYRYLDTRLRLLSPDRFAPLWNSYAKSAAVQRAGVGVSDLTSLLYGDYSGNVALTRAYAEAQTVGVLRAMTEAGRPVLGDGGNLYALPYLSLLNRLPTSSSRASVLWRDIPFAQLVLHGSVAYVSDAMNGAADPQTALLRLIETGSGLHYTLTANRFDKLFDTDNASLYNTNYAACKADVTAQYETLRSALDGLGAAAMTEHRYLTDDVVRVTYDTGAAIYLNYGTAVCTVDGVTIQPHAFVRVDHTAKEQPQ